MAHGWNEGYFTDIEYLYGYYQETNPLFQRLCLLLQGFAPGPSEDPLEANHCELGFGQGVSIGIHAAANPGHFIGTDFNPAQTAHARELVQASGSDAQLFDDSFEQLLARPDLPAFDSISLHGIWSWVSDDNRQVLTRLMRRCLKPGGVLYISYNSLPGWSPTYPLRHLFVTHDRFGTTPKDVIERVNGALQFSEALLEAKPNYLQAAPHLVNQLKDIATQNRHYLAHEYFNQEWRCMYFTEVVDALAEAKLDYACTAVPLDAVNAINLSEPAQAFLSELGHPILREQVRDYFVNKRFRKDLFIRGARRLHPAEQRRQLLATRLVLTLPVDQTPMKVQGVLGEGNLQQERYQPLLNVLAADAHAAKTLEEIVGELPELSWPLLLEMITVLAGMGAIHACQNNDTTTAVQARCDALNRQILDRARYSNDIQTLASPLTGGGIRTGRIAQLFLLAYIHGKTEARQWAQSAWDALQAQDQRVILDGKTLESPEENLQELQRQATEFHTHWLMIYRALKII